MTHKLFRLHVQAMSLCVGVLVFVPPAAAQHDHNAPARRTSTRATRRPTQDASQSSRRSPERFDLRRQFYRDGFGYRYGVPALDQLYEEAIERAYQQGLEEGRMLERTETHSVQTYATYNQAIAAGHSAFAEGRYGLATRLYLLAATLNQGDPTARLSAGLAQAALGQNESAARLLHRAFDLEPRIMLLPMDIRDAYGRQEDFDEHLQTLRRKAASKSAVAGDYFVLGYYQYYSDDMRGAAASLAMATRLEPADRVYAKLADLARSTAPPARTDRR